MDPPVKRAGGCPLRRCASEVEGSTRVLLNRSFELLLAQVPSDGHAVATVIGCSTDSDPIRPLETLWKRSSRTRSHPTIPPSIAPGSPPPPAHSGAEHRSAQRTDGRARRHARSQSGGSRSHSHHRSQDRSPDRRPATDLAADEGKGPAQFQQQIAQVKQQAASDLPFPSGLGDCEEVGLVVGNCRGKRS